MLGRAALARGRIVSVIAPKLTCDSVTHSFTLVFKGGSVQNILKVPHEHEEKLQLTWSQITELASALS